MLILSFVLGDHDNWWRARDYAANDLILHNFYGAVHGFGNPVKRAQNPVVTAQASMDSRYLAVYRSTGDRDSMCCPLSAKASSNTVIIILPKKFATSLLSASDATFC